MQERRGPQWDWQDGQTQELAAAIRGSAPGPDGLPSGQRAAGNA